MLVLVGAISVEKGPDQGIDGRLYFYESPRRIGNTKQVIFSVKGGKNVESKLCMTWGHVVNRENADLGLLITLRSPTKPMRKEAASAGFYNSPWSGGHPKLQILTVEELLSGKRVDIPPVAHTSVTFKQAQRATRVEGAESPRFELD